MICGQQVTVTLISSNSILGLQNQRHAIAVAAITLQNALKASQKQVVEPRTADKRAGACFISVTLEPCISLPVDFEVEAQNAMFDGPLDEKP